MQFSNYFDIPKEELENKSILSYLELLYARIKAPKGMIQAWFVLPHEDENIKRICVFYKIEEMLEKKVVR